VILAVMVYVWVSIFFEHMSEQYAEEGVFDSPSRLTQSPPHYENHQLRQSEKIHRQYESEKLARKICKSMERISHSGDARWGDAPLKALQQLKQMDNMLLGQSERKKLTPEEVEAARLERQQRLEQLSQPRVIHPTRFEVAEVRQQRVAQSAPPNNKAEISELLLNNPLGITIPSRQRRKAARKVKKGKKKVKGKKASKAHASEGRSTTVEHAEAEVREDSGGVDDDEEGIEYEEEHREEVEEQYEEVYEEQVTGHTEQYVDSGELDNMPSGEGEVVAAA